MPGIEGLPLTGSCTTYSLWRTGDVTTSELQDAALAVQGSHISLRSCLSPSTMTAYPDERLENGGLGSITERLIDTRPATERGCTAIGSDTALAAAADLTAVQKADRETPLLSLFASRNLPVRRAGPAATPTGGTLDPAACVPNPATRRPDRRDDRAPRGRAGRARLRQDRNTLVVVTADHAHTAQIIHPDLTSPGLTVNYATTTGSSQDHTGSQVCIAAHGPGAANVVGLTDETDLFLTRKDALRRDRRAPAPTDPWHGKGWGWPWAGWGHRS